MSGRSMSSLKVNLKITGTITNTLTDGSTSSAVQPDLNYLPSLANGIEASQANRGWHSKSRTILHDQQEIIDLYDFAGIDIGVGDGRDGVGQLITLEEIVAIAIVNENAVGTAGYLEVLPSVGEGWSPIGSHTVANGGALLGQGMLCKCQPAAAGFDVTALSHRLTLRASGGDVTYSIYVMGRHDDEESSSSSISSSTSSQSSSSASSQSSSSSISTSSSSISTSSISTSSSSISTSSNSSSVSSSSVSSGSSSSSSSSSSQSESSSSPSSEG